MAGATLSETGVVVIVFGVLWVPLMALAWTGADYGRALKLRSEIQAAADAAVAEGVRRMGESQAAIASTLRATLDAHLRERLRGLPFTFSVGGGHELHLSIQANIATTLPDILDKPAFRFSVTSEAYEPGHAAGEGPSSTQDLTAQVSARTRADADR